MQIGALGQREIVKRDGSFLKSGDILPNAILEYAYNGINDTWQLMSAASAGGFTQLTANLTLYVNYPIGDDTNDGIDNTAAHALKTIQRAVDIAFSYPPSQFFITIIIADSQFYTGFGTPPWVGPNIHVVGNVAAPAGVLVNGGDNHACVCNGVNYMTVEGIRVKTNYPSAGGVIVGGFIATNSALMAVDKCENDQCYGPVFEAFGARLIAGITAHKFDGNCHEALWAMNGGTVYGSDGCVMTIAKPITVTNAFAYSAAGGQISISTGPTFVNPSNVTGKKYYATLNGVVNTSGHGVNYFPGTVAGTVDTGGQYA
jgi:hypothetical protein